MSSPYSIGVKCSIGIGADRGGRARNEDNYVICFNQQIAYREGSHERVIPGEGEGILVGVCDGMGGHRNGEVAATTAARVLAKLYRPGRPRDPAQSMLKYIQESHRRLHWKVRDQGPVSMGTTLTTAWCCQGTLAWAHVGDSRLYLLRDAFLHAITRDHTRNEFLRRDGRDEQADGGAALAQSFIFGSRGLGDDRSLRLEPGLDSGTLRLHPGDKLLLCSDGLWGSVDNPSMTSVMLEIADPQAAVDALVERAIARGSTDNITAMILTVNEVDGDSGEADYWPEQDDDTFIL